MHDSTFNTDLCGLMVFRCTAGSLARTAQWHWRATESLHGSKKSFQLATIISKHLLNRHPLSLWTFFSDLKKNNNIVAIYLVCRQVYRLQSFVSAAFQIKGTLLTQTGSEKRFEMLVLLRRPSCSASLCLSHNIRSYITQRISIKVFRSFSRFRRDQQQQNEQQKAPSLLELVLVAQEAIVKRLKQHKVQQQVASPDFMENKSSAFVLWLMIVFRAATV